MTAYVLGGYAVVIGGLLAYAARVMVRVRALQRLQAAAKDR